nr:hypothetical protein [Tanacetum cinerariifolium]
ARARPHSRHAAATLAPRAGNPARGAGLARAARTQPAAPASQAGLPRGVPAHAARGAYPHLLQPHGRARAQAAPIQLLGQAAGLEIQPP